MPFPSPGDLLDPGIEPASPASAGGFLTTEPPRKPSVPSAARKCSPRVSAQQRGSSRQEDWGARGLGGGPEPSLWQAGRLQI